MIIFDFIIIIQLLFLIYCKLYQVYVICTVIELYQNKILSYGMKYIF